MFSHIQLGVRDLTRMQQFYDSVLAELGLVRVAEERVGEAGVIWRRADRRWPQFVLRAPLNGLPATWANGSQVSFAAPSPDAAAAAWSVALTLGAINEGEPGLRPQYAPDFYGAYCRDPEGNKLCFVYADGVNG
ncbi:VOC family protein [Sodalis endosymbiont of Spalangia cameroni]|uniref:VOC family protein n=1 Tax=Sodalis praecaptivus TaxID=1239307 RepID=UPI0031F9FD09